MCEYLIIFFQCCFLFCDHVGLYSYSNGHELFICGKYCKWFCLQRHHLVRTQKKYILFRQCSQTFQQTHIILIDSNNFSCSFWLLCNSIVMAYLLLKLKHFEFQVHKDVITLFLAVEITLWLAAHTGKTTCINFVWNRPLREREERIQLENSLIPLSHGAEVVSPWQRTYPLTYFVEGI